MNWLLRKLGFKVHKWSITHPSGAEKECLLCGEERSEYIWWVTGPIVTWWETTKSGDGSCSDTKELPTRIY